ncbi:bifunctional oligoribonuclease/PAP phosphatase NrnA [Candidatus Peregrinibacteria bacterium]|nr:bifunctional oligoribonuclease/PAP phosphatase NrnA [Candidatus Peregrinibacteria bacterium]
MEPNTTDQILNLIEKSQNILLLTHARADCDGLGAMLATYIVLNQLGKNVTAVTNDPTPENLAFLPSISIVQNSMSSSKDFVISLDISKVPLNKIKYNMEGGRVNIIITPKGGIYTKEDVSFNEGQNNYDLIIVLDAGNLEHLGPIYDQNSELFFETPIINIDHHSSNTDFGQVNMVDMVAASTTEVLFHVIKEMEKKYDKKFINEDIATLLLAGIITDTGSFQHANTSPKSMEVAAQLLDFGARQQEIIKNIYKTKKLSTLKLWGIVLSKVQVDPEYRMVWSTISKEDLAEADAESNESESIIDDLLTNAPGAEVIMLIKYNEEGYVSVSMRSTSNAIDVGKICADMGGGGHVRAAGYKIRDGKSFEQVVSEALSKVREYQGERLNVHPEDIQIPTQELKPEDKPEPQPTPQPEPQSAPQQEPQSAPQQDSKPKNAKYLEFKKPEKEKREEKPRETTPQKKEEPKRQDNGNDNGNNRGKQQHNQQRQNQQQKNQQQQKPPQLKAQNQNEQSKPNPKPEAKPQEQRKPQPNNEPTPTPKPEPKVEAPKVEPKVEMPTPQPEPQPAPQPEPQPAPQPEPQPAPQPEPQPTETTDSPDNGTETPAIPDWLKSE